MQMQSTPWWRGALVVALAIFAAGLGVLSYRYATRPVTLTVAAGSLDGDAPRLMTAIASRLASSNSHIRLKIVSKDSALDASKAFAAGETDLAIVRSDVGDVPAARALLRIANGVVLIVAPPGSNIDSLDGLKGKTIGVVGGEINRRVSETLKKGGGGSIQFKELTLEEAQPAIRAKQIQAIMLVIPISEKYLAMVRGIAPPGAKLKSKLLPIDAAEAIAAVAPYYESYELPKGTLRGVPPLPEEDLTTLRVPFYLVGKRTLDADVATELTKAIMDARRDLVGEFPILGQVSAPSTEKDAYIQIHPGAKVYFDGEEKGFFDKHGDQLFYGSMALGSVTSLLAALWRFIGFGEAGPARGSPAPFSELSTRIRAARSEAELEAVEADIDTIIGSELQKQTDGDFDGAHAAALSLAIHRLEHLIGQRRQALADHPPLVTSIAPKEQRHGLA